MQIVIDIPEEMYNNAKNDWLCGSQIIVGAIMDGAILPTHGRLIDADEIVMKEYEHVTIDFKDYTDLYNIIAHTFNEIIEKAPTVLEANKDESID
jgi:hypothetical protein